MEQRAFHLLEATIAADNESPQNLGCTTTTCSSTVSASTTKHKNILSRCVDRRVNVGTSSDEVKKWMNYDLLLPDDDDDLLAFWSTNAANYPSIACVAMKVLAIPASNTTIERLFSTTKLTITDRRTRLGTEKVKKIL